MQEIITFLQTTMESAFSQIEGLMGYIWLIGALILLLLEISTPGLFFFLSFACGCITAALMAFLAYPFMWQCIGLAGATITSFLAMRSYFTVSKMTSPTTEEKAPIKTNFHALIGEECVVVKKIEPHKSGQVKVKGEQWAARAKDNVVLHEGTVVLVIGIEGNKLIVQ
ncbi:MAG: NfeD family protein [Epsilonproteobacteria bacterium]|nr:NfeD family protein [Campylobacterota bacterium]